jgi:hypothetical protein
MEKSAEALGATAERLYSEATSLTTDLDRNLGANSPLIKTLSLIDGVVHLSLKATDKMDLSCSDLRSTSIQFQEAAAELKKAAVGVPELITQGCSQGAREMMTVAERVTSHLSLTVGEASKEIAKAGEVIPLQVTAGIQPALSSINNAISGAAAGAERASAQIKVSLDAVPGKLSSSVQSVVEELNRSVVTVEGAIRRQAATLEAREGVAEKNTQGVSDSVTALLNAVEILPKNIESSMNAAIMPVCASIEAAGSTAANELAKSASIGNDKIASLETVIVKADFAAVNSKLSEILSLEAKENSHREKSFLDRLMRR